VIGLAGLLTGSKFNLELEIRGAQAKRAGYSITFSDKQVYQGTKKNDQADHR